MATPSTKDGLHALLGHRKELSPVLDTLQPVTQDVDELINNLPDTPSVAGLTDVRDAVLSRFTKSRVADLLGNYAISRREQIKTLMAIGKEPMLELIAQGAMPTELSRDLQVGHRFLLEFLERVCTPEELKRSLEQGSRMVVFNSVEAIHDAYDKDDTVKAKSVLDANLRFVKAYTDQFEAKPTSTSVEVTNNIGERSAPFLQVVSLPERESLPKLKEHSHTAEQAAEFRPAHIEDGVFELITDDQ